MFADSAPFTVRFWDGSLQTYGSGSPLFTLVLHSPEVVDRLRNDPQKGFGEAYTDGLLDVEQGDLADVIALACTTLMRREVVSDTGRKIDLGGFWKNAMDAAAGSLQRRTTGKQQEDVALHYDLGNEFFKLWLDDTLTYSCAYFRTPTDTLELAQHQKREHVLNKLRLKEGDSLLDIGCGWGELVMQSVRRSDVKALGITLSEEQYAAGCSKIHASGLEMSADVRLIHYDALAREGRKFDKIASIGMIEHVGKSHLAEYSRAVATLLNPGGLALLHTITSPIEGPFNPWLEKYIFPGAYLPTVSELIGHFAAHDLRIIDVENLRPHYQMTVDHWSERFEAAVPQITAMLGDKFVRMWRMYLRGSSASLRVGTSEIHQFLVSKGTSQTLPLTREDLYR